MTKPKQWQLQEAKAKFSEVFDRALTTGPQYVTRRGKDEVVVVRRSEFEALRNHNRQPSIIEAFLAGPKVPEFSIKRDKNDVVGRGPSIFDE